MIRSTIALLAVLGIDTLASADSSVDFGRDVRPILARHCFKCHGPDPKTREAELRLDLRDDATRDRGGYAAIVPGDVEASEIIFRLELDDDSRMPPPDSKRVVSPAEKETLRRWIKEGAEYRPHWAFVPPRRPEPPAVQHRDWPRNPIDRFVLARLEAEGLEPSPEADRYTLARRAYLDLVGLPPTPEEADAFANDPSPTAYEDLIERLLASPRYGERWARRWLDLARYSDTNGYEKDRPRSAWPYRDWVLRAINADMPFDRFTVEQIAGDLLPGAGLDQRVATGFHRNTMLNEEGGIDPLEFRFHAMTDRVATTGSVWLGLTVGCAQCHTHKFDPITHRDYYGMFAFLNNTEEPDLDLPDPAVDRRRAELASEIARLEAGLADQFPVDPEGCCEGVPAESRARHLARRFGAWLDEERARTRTWEPLEPIRAEANLPLLTVEPDGAIFASGDQTKADTYRITYRLPSGTIRAIRLDALPDDRLPAHGPGRTFYEGRKGDFFLNEVRIEADGRPVHVEGATEDFGKLGIGSGDAKAALALDGNAHTGWSTSGREGEPHHAVFPLETPIEGAGDLEIEMDFGRHYAAGLGRFRVSVTLEDGPAVARDVPPDVEALLNSPVCQLNDAGLARLRTFFLGIAPELAKARKPIEKLKAEWPDYPTALVMTERPAENPRPTFRHHRGEFLQPKEPIEPGTLEFLHPYPDDQPRDRLGFARWLVDPSNPLVARVTVNRSWSILFGGGLVATVGDFGFQGEPPSHPGLLDWLAVEFMERGWSVKDLHRRIVASATYRQSSRVTPESHAADPTNRLLGRGPSIRVDAEVVRDLTLRASGLLAEEIGGPSVFPPQPASVTTEGTYGKLAWKVSEGPERHRRGLYTFSKRTAPFAMANTFDAPSGEACATSREASNTPLQALTMLNDAVMVEATRALGRSIAVEAGTDEARATDLFRRCLVRPPTVRELAPIVGFARSQRARLRLGELDPAAIAGPGEGDPVEAATWAAVARVLLNLDETITKD